MRRSTLGPLVLVVVITSACGPDPTASSPGDATGAPASPTAESPAPSSPPPRVPFPAGFPILPGAVAAPMPDDDPGLIGLWISDQPGSTAYDFFLAALPAAGYPIQTAFAGGTVAQLLISTPGGATWQIDLYTNPDLTTRIELRLPRP